MLGVIIVFFSSLFVEISDTITKVKLNQREISIYSLGVINYFFIALIFIAVNIYYREFSFSLASLPTFGVRAAAEIILTPIALKAVYRADRSTFGFIRVVTMPLLILVDIFTGYKINPYQLIGMAIIIIAMTLIFSTQGIKKRGAFLSSMTAVLAVIPIALYKYDITYYNSVAAEQTVMYLILIVFLSLMAVFVAKENPFSFFKQPIYRYQTLLSALPSFLISYAYVFAPASVILSAYRSSAVFWSVISGKFYFKERHLMIKLLCLLLLIGGIILLAIN